MRTLTLITILSATACAGPKQPTPMAPLIGSIDGQPFEPRSALMTEVNWTAHRWDTGQRVTVSTIYVFERAVTCAEISKLEDRSRLTLAEKERGIEIDIVGPWPRERAVLVTDKDVDAAVQTGESRTDVQGQVTIVEATGVAGTISLDLKNPYSNDGARGDVRFAVCQ